MFFIDYASEEDNNFVTLERFLCVRLYCRKCKRKEVVFPQSVLFWLIVFRSVKGVGKFAYSTPVRIQDICKSLALNFLAIPLRALGTLREYVNAKI